MLGEPSSTHEPVIAPLPHGELANYLILYAYPTGQVEFHCSAMDPGLQLKMLAIMADGMSKAYLQAIAQAAKDEPRIKLVNGG